MSNIEKENLLFQAIAQQLASNPVNASANRRAPEKDRYEDSRRLSDLFKKQVLETCRDLKIGKNRLVVSFNKSTKPIVSIALQVDCIKITINAKYGTLKDEKKLMRDVSKVGHVGSGDYQVKVSSDEHFEYILGLVKQAY
jgi:predicted transport protein